MRDLLLAAPGIAIEPALVSAAPRHGVRVLRRCLDAAELLAAAAAEPGAVVMLSTGLPRLSVDVVSRLRGGADGEREVLGLAVDDDDAIRLRAIGVPVVLEVAADPDPVLAAVGTTATSRRDRADSRPDGETDDRPHGRPDRWQARSAAAGAPVPGRIVAVWGPQGAPGRTTVAVGLAESLAASGHRVCLVDADTYAPSVTMMLGIVEETSGIVVACRRAEVAGAGAGGPTPPAGVTSAARSLADGWDVLGGLPTPERWPELRPAGLDRLWEECARAYDVTVVDVGFCLETDDADPWSRSRNAAAVSAVSASDVVVAVGDAAPAGAVRLARAWSAVERIRAGRAAVVVRNRSEGRDRGWEQVVRAAGAPSPAIAVPEDGRALRACWRRARTPGEGARRSPVRRALADLSRIVVSG